MTTTIHHIVQIVRTDTEENRTISRTYTTTQSFKNEEALYEACVADIHAYKQTKIGQRHLEQTNGFLNWGDAVDNNVFRILTPIEQHKKPFLCSGKEWSLIVDQNDLMVDLGLEDNHPNESSIDDDSGTQYDKSN